MEKFWSPTYFIYNLHKNAILYVTLHARKVTIEERKQLETIWVTLSFKATVVLRWYVSGLKVMVVSMVILNEANHKTFKVHGFHCETNMGPCVFSLCYFFEMLFFTFHLLSLKDSKFGLTFWLNLHCPHIKTSVIPSTDWYLLPFLRQMKSTWCWSAPAIPVSEEAAETIWRAVNAVSTCWNTFNFFDYLVSDWFPNITILKQKLCRGFLQLSNKTRVASWQPVPKI